MNIRFTKNKAFIIFSILIIFIFSNIAFSEEKNTFRKFLNNALRAYIEQNYEDVLVNLKKASLIMRNLASLRSEALLFCDTINMFADYIPRKNAVFSPGETFLVYFQPGNYSLLKKDNMWEVNLKEYFKILDKNGKIIKEMPSPLEFHVTLYSPLTTGLYFRNADFVPDKEGTYTLIIILEDLIKGKVLKVKLPFEVKDSK